MSRKVFDYEIVKNRVSVIVPLFGDFDRTRFYLALQSLGNQKGIDLEVVIAEQSGSPSIDVSQLEINVKYLHVPSNNLVDGKYFRPGFVRNLAAKNSNGEYLYNTDGDIIFTNPNFLVNSLRIFKTGLYRPPMRRLPLENFQEFFEENMKNGLGNAIANLSIEHPYLATSKKNPIKMKVFEKHEEERKKIFLYTEGDHKKYLSDPSNKGKEPVFSTLHTHAGAILMKREHFEIVGGYCEQFAGWGCHDADLQWKLREIFKIEEFPNDSKFEVLHLDHERSYFSKERLSKNIEIQNRRRTQGIIKSIEEDLQ